MTRFWKMISAAFAGLVAIVALLGNLDKAHTGWCEYIGFLCSFEVSSAPISPSVSPGNPCNNSYPQVCVQPTTKYRRLIVESMKFVPTARTGNHYNNGSAAKEKIEASETGWYGGPKDEANSRRICITAYARTGACEDKYSMTGHIEVMERI